jgi:hypothetical protein
MNWPRGPFCLDEDWSQERQEVESVKNGIFDPSQAW